MPPYTFFVPFQVTARVKKSKTAKGKDDIDIKNIQADSIIPGNFFINNAVKDVSLWPFSQSQSEQSVKYVSLRLRVQNAVSAQPCVGKFRISLVLLNFLHCNF